jgi:hypothetical protein
METSDLIASAAVCDKARYPTNLHVGAQGLVLAMNGPNESGLVVHRVVPWQEIDGVAFPPCALIASAVVDLEDEMAAALAAVPLPPELTQAQKIKMAHAAVTDFMRSGPGALELLLEAAMMNLMMSGGDAGRERVSEIAVKVGALCGRARPGSVALAAVD